MGGLLPPPQQFISTINTDSRLSVWQHAQGSALNHAQPRCWTHDSKDPCMKLICLETPYVMQGFISIFT